MSDSVRDLILRHVPKDGGAIGNIKLMEIIRKEADRQGLPFDEADYQAARESLVAEGRLAKGRGRGGSVYRPDGQAGTASESSRPGAAATAGREGTPEVGPDGQYGSYRHPDPAVLRPDVGVQDQFPARRKPKQYRYDSSLAPELAWDENAGREFAEWLLELVTRAADQGETHVFAEPQVWKGTGEAFHSTSQCAARLKSLTQPFLNWAGKAERHEITVPTVPLFVHERHSTRAILERLQSYKAAGQNMELFGDPQVDIADRLDAYEHTGPWTNRMILGDSLQVMNSLLEYEGLGGQVQMIYLDPPYGVKYGSNFQPFVRNKDVAHGKDNEMIREPEMVKAYRDTWELGLHSYLSYLRDRLRLARELLAESGSVFVQISDENVHHVRELMDEILGPDNLIAICVIQKTAGATSELMPSTADFVIWYAKDRRRIKFRKIYKDKLDAATAERYDQVELSDGTRRRLTKEEKSNPKLLPEGARRFQLSALTSTKPPGDFAVSFEDGVYTPRSGYWKTGEHGFENIIGAKRVVATSGGTLRYVRYLADFPVREIGSVWSDIYGSVQSRSDPKIYAVQTSAEVIERCQLMTTDPGDLVFDPTCGSGTTALVAEQWGRRWITCDTSRVPLALARQRLLTATFPWYELKEPRRGPSGGFVYQRKQNRKGEEVGGLVPRITLKSIANDEEAEMVTLVDRPEVKKGITRVCGPFSVEATIQAAATMDEPAAGGTADTRATYENPRAYLDRMIEVLRRAHSLRLPGNESIALDSVRPLADAGRLHAEATLEGDGGKTQRVAIAFGPEDGAIDSQFVVDAVRDAHSLSYDQLYLFGFAIQAKARELVDKRDGFRGVPCAYVNVTPDVVMSDLLKTSSTDQIFSITGLPDVRVRRAGSQDNGQPLYQVELLGLDVFRPNDMETESIDAENLPCWMLDVDYNGMVFCASQVFFPRTGAWENLRKSLKAEFDDSVWEHLAGTESEPFPAGDLRRIAVKVIDERGNELMVVRSLDEAPA